MGIKPHLDQTPLMEIYKEYEKEYILILLTPRGGAAEGRAPLFCLFH